MRLIPLRVLVPAVTVLTVALSGCSGGSDSGGSAEAPLPQQVAGDTADGLGTAARDAASSAGPALQTRALIRRGSVELRSEDVAGSQREAQRVVDRYAGEVAEQTTTTDDEGRPAHARMVLRVPTEHFTEAMAALEAAGELVRSNTDEDDVSTEVIDVRTRLQVQRRSIARIATLLDRARDIRDIIVIESHLARRQAVLDSLERRAAYLAGQTSMATITVDVERIEEAVADTDRTGFLAGLSAGWGGLTAFAVALATVAGALLPWLVLLALLGPPALVAARAARRRRARPAEPTASGS